jgi:hypothetical protein
MTSKVIDFRKYNYFDKKPGEFTPEELQIFEDVGESIKEDIGKFGGGMVLALNCALSLLPLSSVHWPTFTKAVLFSANLCTNLSTDVLYSLQRMVRYKTNRYAQIGDFHICDIYPPYESFNDLVHECNDANPNIGTFIYAFQQNYAELLESLGFQWKFIEVSYPFYERFDTQSILENVCCRIDSTRSHIHHKLAVMENAKEFLKTKGVTFPSECSSRTEEEKKSCSCECKNKRTKTSTKKSKHEE